MKQDNNNLFKINKSSQVQVCQLKIILCRNAKSLEKLIDQREKKEFSLDYLGKI